MRESVCKLNSEANSSKAKQPNPSNILSFEEICSDSPRVNTRVSRGVLFFLFLSPTYPCILLKVAFVPLELFFNTQVLAKFVLGLPSQTNRGVRSPVFAPHVSCILPNMYFYRQINSNRNKLKMK